MTFRLLPNERYSRALPVTAQADCDPFFFSPVLCAPALHLTSRTNAELQGVGSPTGAESADRSASSVALAGRSLLLGDGDRAASYARWLLLWMPLLGLASGGSVVPVRFDHLIVPPLRHPWQRAMLERTASRDIRIVERASHDLLCESLYRPDVEDEADLLMNRVTPGLLKHVWAPAPPVPSRRLYVEWSNDPASRSDDLPALHTLLDTAGFEQLTVASLQVDELAAACSAATVLVSASPELLANMVFCRPGTPVIELIGSHARPTSYRLATLCGHHYHAVLADPCRQFPALVASRIEGAQSGRGAREGPRARAELPLDALARLLERMGSPGR